MKTILIVLISMFTIEITFAQTGADYYLPLCTGNHVDFYTDGTPSGWAARKTFYRIIRSDSINGKLYYMEQASEILDNHPTATLTFRTLWLRKDSIGNIVVGAYDPSNSGILDSAIILNPKPLLFPNQYLTAGYSQSYLSPGGIEIDSVISVNASAGTYTNCIQIRTTWKVNGNISYIDDAYYAYHLGRVKDYRLYPAYQIHTDNLTGYTATNCNTGISDHFFENNPEIGLFPNPTNGKFTLTFRHQNGKLGDPGVEIYNVMGEKIYSATVKQQPSNEIDLRNSPRGCYFIKINDGEKRYTTDLIIQ